MHAATKILVVFVALLSIFLSALTISYASNADAIVKSLRDAEAKARAAADEARLQIQQASTERASLMADKEALSASKAGLEREVTTLSNERASLLAEGERLRAASLGKEGQITQLQTTNQTLSDLISAMRDEVVGLREDLLRGSRREIELADRINDLESQNEVLDQNVRALREQLVAMQSQNAGGGGISQLGGLGQARPIRGFVLETRPNPAGGMLAVIDVGSNNGVSMNQELNIVRGNEFLAKLIITRVEPQRAIGTINTLGRQVSVQPNDLVLSRLD